MRVRPKGGKKMARNRTQTTAGAKIRKPPMYLQGSIAASLRSSVNNSATLLNPSDKSVKGFILGFPLVYGFFVFGVRCSGGEVVCFDDLL